MEVASTIFRNTKDLSTLALTTVGWTDHRMASVGQLYQASMMETYGSLKRFKTTCIWAIILESFGSMTEIILLLYGRLQAASYQ